MGVEVLHTSLQLHPPAMPTSEWHPEFGAYKKVALSEHPHPRCWMGVDMPHTILQLQPPGHANLKMASRVRSIQDGGVERTSTPVVPAAACNSPGDRPPAKGHITKSYSDQVRRHAAGTNLMSGPARLYAAKGRVTHVTVHVTVTLRKTKTL
jgi:hypothetical protein